MATIPESSLPADEDLASAVRRVEAATGLRFADVPTIEWVEADVVDDARLASPLDSAAAPSLQGACWELFRDRLATVPGAVAVAMPAGRSPSIYDVDQRTLLLARADGTDRRSDLARTEALALSLIDEHLDLAARLEREGATGDRKEALLAFAYGLAWVATLESSTAPVFGFDASAAPLRRRHAARTRRLLEDPDGAVADLLTDPDLTSAERRLLERIIEVSGAERRRRVLRLAVGARLVLEAKDRLTNGNLALLAESPPRSSEQLLHVDRFLDRDDPPVSITRLPRDGLLGPGWSVDATDVAGEYGLLLALSGALPHDEAADAATGWGGDLLTLFERRADDGSDLGENGSTGRGLAWRLEFDDRFEAKEAVRAFRVAITRTYGGAFPELPGSDGVVSLAGGVVPASIQRVKSSLAVVISGEASAHRPALTRLLTEVAKPPETHRSGRQGDPFRWVRRLASPIFFDQPGRWDTLMRVGYGLVARHRAYPEGGENRILNLSELGLLGFCPIPEELSSLLAGGEGGAHRRDLLLLGRSIRWFEEYRSEAERFWSPAVSWTRTPEYRSFGVGYGFLWEQGEGAGRTVFAPRPLWSSTSELDGQSEELGVLFDAVAWREREETDGRFRLLPFGMLLDWTSSDYGVDVRLARAGLRVRSHEVVPGAGRFDLSMLGGWLVRVHHDGARACWEDSVGRGLLFGVRGDPDGWSAGLIQVFGRSFLGGGSDAGDGFADFFWMRF